MSFHDGLICVLLDHWGGRRGHFGGHGFGWRIEDRRALTKLGAGQRVDAIRGRGSLGLEFGFNVGRGGR
jgi:hypothetical protein